MPGFDGRCPQGTGPITGGAEVFLGRGHDHLLDTISAPCVAMDEAVFHGAEAEVLVAVTQEAGIGQLIITFIMFPHTVLMIRVLKQLRRKWNLLRTKLHQWNRNQERSAGELKN